MLAAFEPDGSLNVVIESPRGLTAKFKHDPQNNVMRLGRPLPAGLAYPYDWGFVAGTHASDGDPLDAMVVWDGASYPGVVVPSRAIGVLRVEQTNLVSRARERNDRILAVPVKAPRWQWLTTVFDLDDRWRGEIEQFFIAAVAFEGKDVRLLGWGDAHDATDLIRQSLT